MKKTLAYLCGLALSLAAFAQTPAPSVPTTPPPGYTAVTVGSSTQLIPTLDTVLKNITAVSEGQSILSLVGQGEVNTAGVIANLKAWATSYCAEQPLATGCDSATSIATATAPYVTELQNAFALVPASQWNPQTFTATGMPVNALGFVQAAAAAAASTAPTQTTSQLIVGNCFPISGINSPSGTECSLAPGATLAMVTNGRIISQNGQLYLTHVSLGLMGTSVWFEPVTN